MNLWNYLVSYASLSLSYLLVGRFFADDVHDLKACCQTIRLVSTAIASSCPTVSHIK